MATSSEWTAYVEATTDADPGGTETSAWTVWVEATTDTNPAAVGQRNVRRAGGWVAITGRQVRRSGVWG